MKVLCCHPSGLFYTKCFLRLEPIGLELVAAAARRAGHQVRLVDLQLYSPADFFRELHEFEPDAVCFGLNYLANVPEVIELCRAAKERRPDLFVFVGGHSASFTAQELLEHSQGAIDAVVRGEGENTLPAVLEAAAADRKNLARVPGVVTCEGTGPAPQMIKDLDVILPARDLLRKRRKYFIGLLDPCASVEFTRGCPWDCAFCSAWTFYGRAYRQRSPEAIADELAAIREPGVFIVDDVAFIHPEHGFAIGRELEKRGIKKQYYLETRGDVLLRNKEVFQYWKRLGLRYMFLGVEAIDEQGLLLYRKRATLNKNFEALEFARSLDIEVAINLIVDPQWEASRFAVIREWGLSVPEIVNLSINTPYPGTETFHTEARTFTTQDYRLFDIQHAVLPTKLPLETFYQELVTTQLAMYKKHLSASALRRLAFQLLRLLLRGQTNAASVVWKMKRVFDARRMVADHQQPVKYPMRLPAPPARRTLPTREQLYILQPQAPPAGASVS